MAMIDNHSQGQRKTIRRNGEIWERGKD